MNMTEVQKVVNGFTRYTKYDVKKVMCNTNKIIKIASSFPLESILDDIKIYFMMLSDVFNKKYTKVPKATIAGIIGVLLYILCPKDMVNDLIPALGFLDDVAVFRFCAKFISYDVEMYKKEKGIV